jgi:hypothetical protein
MRLGLKLAAFGIIVLLPKTHLYLSNAYLSKAQTTAERTMTGPVARRDINSMSYLTVSAGGEQAKRATCAAKPGHDASNSVVLYAMDENGKGSSTPRGHG